MNLRRTIRRVFFVIAGSTLLATSIIGVAQLGFNWSERRNTDVALASRYEVMGTTDKIEDIESTVRRDRSLLWSISTIKLPTSETLRVVYFFNSNNGWVAGGTKIFKTSDGGDSWQRITVDAPDEAAVVDFSFVDELNGWVLLVQQSSADTSDNHYWLMRTQDGGKTWARKFEGHSAVATHVVFTDQHNGWLTGVTVDETSSRRFLPLVLYSRDGGEQWSNVSEQLRRVADRETWITSIVPDGSNGASVLGLRGSISRTTNRGETWERVMAFKDEPKQTCLCRLALTEERQYWVAGGAGGLEGTWGMVAVQRDKSWIRYRLSGTYFADASMLSDREGFACGSGPATEGDESGSEPGVLLYTSDGGESWNTEFQSGSENINALTAVNKNEVWAVGDGGLILRVRRRG